MKSLTSLVVGQHSQRFSNSFAAVVELLFFLSHIDDFTSLPNMSFAFHVDDLTQADSLLSHYKPRST